LQAGIQMRVFAEQKSLARLSLLICLLVFASFPCISEMKINDTAPNITLRDTRNKLVFGKAILKEKPILVSFFFTDCLPCKKEIPELDELNKKYSSKIKMFLVATDKEGSDVVIPYIEKMKVSIDVLIDRYSDAAKDFGVTQYPSLFIIGRDGKIIYSCKEYNKDNIKNIEQILSRLK
jgi:peroxiredoxin